MARLRRPLGRGSGDPKGGEAERLELHHRVPYLQKAVVQTLCRCEETSSSAGPVITSTGEMNMIKTYLISPGDDEGSSCQELMRGELQAYCPLAEGGIQGSEGAPLYEGQKDFAFGLVGTLLSRYARRKRAMTLGTFRSSPISR